MKRSRRNMIPHLATLVTTIFGPRLGKFKICHMSSANGVGIELFEFIEPATELCKEEEDNFEYWKTGYFHIALTEPNIEELADKIALSGGKRRTDIMESVPGSSKKICFCEDPFGNVIEIYSHSYEEFWLTLSSRALITINSYQSCLLLIDCHSSGDSRTVQMCPYK